MTSVGPSVLKVVRVPIPSDCRSHCAPFLQSKQNELVTAFAKPKKNVVVILCKHKGGFERKRHCEF